MDNLAGRDVWDGCVMLNAAYDQFPDLRVFSNVTAAVDVSLSAIFNVTKTNGRDVVISRALVLSDAVQKAAIGKVVAEEGGPMLKRAPVAIIQGQSAEEVGSAALVFYSNYVAALFENFD